MGRSLVTRVYQGRDEGRGKIDIIMCTICGPCCSVQCLNDPAHAAARSSARFAMHAFQQRLQVVHLAFPTYNGFQCAERRQSLRRTFCANAGNFRQSFRPMGSEQWRQHQILKEPNAFSTCSRPYHSHGVTGAQLSHARSMLLLLS